MGSLYCILVYMRMRHNGPSVRSSLDSKYGNKNTSASFLKRKNQFIKILWNENGNIIKHNWLYAWTFIRFFAIQFHSIYIHISTRNERIFNNFLDVPVKRKTLLQFTFILLPIFILCFSFSIKFILFLIVTIAAIQIYFYHLNLNANNSMRCDAMISVISIGWSIDHL